jgi:hypothetical protein
MAKLKFKAEIISIGTLNSSDKNPRTITDRNLEKLSESLKSFPKMKEIREVIVDENYTILGGNQRYKALVVNGEEMVSVLKVTGLTEEQKDSFMIKDNVNFGVWDWEILQSNYDSEMLTKFGLNVWTPELADMEDEMLTDESANEIKLVDQDKQISDDEKDFEVVVIDFNTHDYDFAKELVEQTQMKDINIAKVLYSELLREMDAS